MWEWIIPLAVNAFSSVMSNDAAAEGNEQAGAINEAGRARGVAAITAGGTEARGYLNPQLEQAKRTFGTGVNYLTNIASRDPNVLTPQQKIDLADRQRIALRGINPGLRGSGRFTTAALNDVVNRGKAGMIASNTGRADSAANTLTSQGGAMQSNAVNALSNVATNQGSNIANIETGAAANAANLATGTGAANSETFGQIGSFFADAMKQQGRDSRYSEYRAASG